jgi:hypothetical protein
MAESQRTTHSKLTNLPAEHYFGGLDYSIRRKKMPSFWSNHA